MQAHRMLKGPSATAASNGRSLAPRAAAAPRTVRAHHSRRAAAPREPPSSDNGAGQGQPAGAQSPAQVTSALLAGLAQRLEAANLLRRGSGSSGGSGGSGGGMSRSGSGSASGITSPLSSIDPEEAAAAAAQAAREAFSSGDLGFGFSAGGLLFPYYCGSVDELSKLGIIKDDTKLAGASAGSLIVACARSGLPMSTITDACYSLADDCRSNGTRFRLGPVLENVLRGMLPADVARSVSGRTYVAVTRVLPEDGRLLAPRLVSEFDDRDDLISALMTSCHIPIYMNGSLVTRFRGAPHFDGGITDFLPSPAGARHTVRVCCLPSRQLAALGPIHISPDMYSGWPYTLREMLAWAFEPAEQGMLEELVERGRADARAWAAATGVGALAAAEAAKAAGVQDRGGLVLP